VKFVGGFETVD